MRGPRGGAGARPARGGPAPPPRAATGSGGAGAPVVGAASSCRTSSAPTWVKSQNAASTARKGEGIVAHTMSSARPRTSRQVDSGAAGTATTRWAGSAARTASIAANSVAPVEVPSSTTITVRPASAAGARSPRHVARSRGSSAAASRAAVRTCSAVSRRPRTMSSLTTTRPSGASAPMTSSGRPGARSARTTSTSSGAASAAAISQATGTPPRASPSTTTVSSPR